MANDNLTIKQQRFVTEYLRCGNATQAYRVAYDCSNMKPETVGRKAHELIQHGKISAQLASANKSWRESTLETLRDAHRELIDIHLADPNELTQHRRLGCRHCNGVNFAYQWKHQAEFSAAIAKAVDINADRTLMRPKRKPLPMPTDTGGYGFKANADPHPDCPECDGEGVGNVYVADTRKLSPRGRKLFAGVKQTKDGLQVLMRDQDGALQALIKLLAEKEAKPPAPVTADGEVPSDPVMAARFYKELMNR